MRKLWQDEAWEEYLYWQTQDKKTLKKINRLLTDIDRNGYQCTGKKCTSNCIKYYEFGVRRSTQEAEEVPLLRV